jgi:ABC-2 type transport system ATP-binding protein
MDQATVLEAFRINKTLGNKKVVSDLSFSVMQGDVFGFLGPNGAGKTTTIRMLLGLIAMDSGSVKINGYDTKTDFNRAIGKVGAVVETPKFYPYLSAYHNLRLIANLHPELPKSRIGEVLEIVGLASRANDKVKTYSLGMKQRLGLARALLNHPGLVFLDEPSNGLDPQGMIEIREMISQLALEQDITFFITSHLLYEVEQVCNKVAILKEGRLITQMPMKELSASQNEKVEIITGQISAAIEILRERSMVKSVHPRAGSLIVEIEKGCSNQINQLLVSQQVAVDYLIPKNQSLEEFFIELTEGGKNIA